ncbi:hypothetical protein [Bacillus sp. PS06]|uniref:hypothetical protein n=1 Tax=Bacillus sp. PS06 TaxID=2764176 RepID=UPI001784C39F|nr:hypothetical protein [Bacillus sp. PS06]MBD8071202.1 hypothetical protein [Bacillus sp. PS06]
MQIRVGVVGPEDSVYQIMKAGQQFKELNLIPYVYERTEETVDLICRNKEWIDQWFFSGQAPYYYALSKGVITEEEASYTPLQGSSLLGTLLEAFVKEGRILYRLSFDTIQVDEIEDVQESFSLNDLTMYTNAYPGYMPAEDIIQFHKDLYDAQKIDVAITCINSVYQALKKLGVPTYRVVQSEISTHRVLGSIKERGQTSWYRKSQLVIVGIEVIYPSSSEGQQLSFKIKHQELELNRVLLGFVEKINGSLAEIGNGLYYIYTTRGELDLFLKQNSIQTQLDKIYVNSKLHARVGVGYGKTVLEAEQNVRVAFEHARVHQGSVVITITEDKEVIELVAENELLTYQRRHLGDEWEKVFKDASISPSLASKIESLSSHYGQKAITSIELARWLKSTERNARRILAEMERIGLASVKGEESGQRGRPRKIYELKFNQGK